MSSTSLTLALFRRLPPERVEGFVMQASEKPAQERSFASCINRRHINFTGCQSSLGRCSKPHFLFGKDVKALTPKNDLQAVLGPDGKWLFTSKSGKAFSPGPA